ncbi:hypothetical protein DYB32_004101 [Aphanomyces invadans]|uniref:WW domain-containing protein n=1 Tax=Aphanomyces invadans TaxID=157072 RepID=A0A418AYM2_9STRA|nr:hypothetical protein DYB32_004101 [Aphanomyces invadans]
MTPPTARSPSSYGGSPVTHQKTSFGIAQAQYDEHLAPLEGVDPNLFMEGVKEHAKYLGMDPQRDNDMLWIARESLVAPMPTGWHQIMTKEGVPYYYNDHTGESRWEHPSDQDYMALYQEVMRMKLAGEPIDVSRLKYQFVQRQALNTHQHHGAGLHLDDAWARSGSSGSYHIDTPTDPHDGYNQGQYEACEYDDEAHECTGEDIPYSPRDDDDNGSDIQVTTTRRGGAALDDMPVGWTPSQMYFVPNDDGHRALVESLYAQLNECKTKLELQQQHQDVVDALQKSLYDITGQLEAHVKEVAYDSPFSAFELYISRVTLRCSQSARARGLIGECRQKQLKKETKLRFQWEQKFKSLEEQHQALMIQVNDANRKHELDRHVAQGDVEAAQSTRRIKQLEASETANVKQIASLQAELDALKTSVQAQMDQAKQAGIAEATAKMHAAVRAAVEEKDQLAQLYAQEMKARRQLHNRVMEMAGNIRVFCRIRPVSNVEVTSADSAQVVTFRPNDPHVLDLTVAEGQKHTFEFDYVFQVVAASS